MAFINANKTIFLKAVIQNHIEPLYIVNLIVTQQILFHKQQCVAAHKNDIKYSEKIIKYIWNMSTVTLLLFYSHCLNLNY